jgi:small subunit ribosomal protein S17e
MGRIKTKLIKRVTRDLVREHREELKKDFNENKLIVSRLLRINSKKMRNAIAGYATRILKEEQYIKEI